MGRTGHPAGGTSSTAPVASAAGLAPANLSSSFVVCVESERPGGRTAPCPVRGSADRSSGLSARPCALRGGRIGPLYPAHRRRRAGGYAPATLLQASWHRKAGRRTASSLATPGRRAHLRQIGRAHV